MPQVNEVSWFYLGLTFGIIFFSFSLTLSYIAYNGQRTKSVDLKPLYFSFML